MQRAADRPRCQQDLETTTRTKVAQYHEAYANRQGTPSLSKLCHVDPWSDSRGVPSPLLHPCSLCTLKHFADMGDHEPGTNAFTCHLSQYFWKHKPAISFGKAIPVARLSHLAQPPSSSTVGWCTWPLSRYLCRHPSPPSLSLDTFHLPLLWSTPSS